ncbi:MAG: hypothetical protein DSZ28_09855, partial [Thiothrix sp.]
MLPVLAIAGAVALGSSLAFGRQSKILKRKRYPTGRLDTKLPARSQESSTGPAGQAHGKILHSRDLFQGAEKVKKGVLAIRKVFAISMGGAQERDKQFHRLTAQQGKDSANAVDQKLNRRIRLSLGLMGLAAAGSFFYAPLLLIAGAGTLINNLPVFL